MKAWACDITEEDIEPTASGLELYVGLRKDSLWGLPEGHSRGLQVQIRAETHSWSLGIINKAQRSVWCREGKRNLIINEMNRKITRWPRNESNKFE